MPSTKDLLAPFTDVFLAKVDGTIFGIQGTQTVVRIFYWLSVLFGCFVFIGGIISTGIDVDDLITQSEIRPMIPTVNYPVVWGCIPDMMGIQAGFKLAAPEMGSDTAEGWKPGAKISGYGVDDVATFSELKLYGDGPNELAMDAAAPFFEQEKRAKLLMTEMLKTLGSGFSEKYCFVTNYDQTFKPNYEKKTKLSVSVKQQNTITEKDLYSVMGFFEDGSTKADQASFSYAGFQNVLQTIGIGIDEEVDAKGMSYAPKTKGTKKEVYTMNTAGSTAQYQKMTVDGVGDVTTGGQVSTTNGGDGATDRSLRTTYYFYMDTFIRRRTTIRNKSISEIFAELGASFAASMIFISILFKAGPENSTVFRFCDTSPKSVVKEIKASKDQAEKSAPVAAGAVEGYLNN